MKRSALGLIMALVGCSSDTTSAECRNNAECEGGKVCESGACETLCVADDECPSGEICSSSLCAPGLREVPLIDTVDGDGTVICPQTPGQNCLVSALVIRGSRLEGARFELSSPTTSDVLAVMPGSSDTLVTAAMPDVPPGSYTLRATNAAGSADQALSLLQGESGPTGPAGAGGASGPSGPAGPSGPPGADAFAPVGTVMAFAGPMANVPAGWMVCDGREVSRTGFAGLFAAIGLYHGQGDASTTFNIPDFRGMFLRGVDGGRGMDPDAATRSVSHPVDMNADEVGSTQSAELESHRHQEQGSNRLDVASGGGIHVQDVDNVSFASVFTDFVGGSETRPVNAYVNYIIRVQ